MELERANAEATKIQKGWTEELKEFHEKTTRMEEEREQLKAERDKYMNMISAHAARAHKRSQEQVEEKAIAAKLAEDYLELRRIAEQKRKRCSCAGKSGPQEKEGG